jgi:hypothetical protein|tara:strand:+ start:2501 stop:3541 length:1041 start_codon:yes stop_codon:yes gene_type:complete
MADTQEAPQLDGLQPIPALGGSIIEAQEALLSLTEPEEETLEEEEAQPTEEEESQPEEEDESLEEESEEEEIEEASEDADEPVEEGEDLYAVTVNGEEQTIPLDELLKGYSRQSDYTKKTQELSQQRRGMDDLHKKWESEIAQIGSERQYYVNALQSAMDGSMGQLNQFANIDWETLKNENPLAYVTKRDEYRETQDNLRRFEAQQKEAIAAQKAANHESHQRMVHEEHGKLVEALPDWAEPDKRQSLGEEIKAYAVSQGYSPQEIKGLVDHRNFLTLYKSMKYDKASSPDVVKKKVKNKPRVIRAGSPRVKSDNDRTQRRKSMKRLQGTGHIDDASALLEDFIDI